MSWIDKLFDWMSGPEEEQEPKPVFDPNAQAKRYDRIRDLNAIRTELFNELDREPTVHEIWERDNATASNEDG